MRILHTVFKEREQQRSEATVEQQKSEASVEQERSEASVEQERSEVPVKQETPVQEAEISEQIPEEGK